ncbi:MAG: EF-hand domain-containing protein [Opitutales bacterium]|nr:EF-hand domain-containing protein [Opitutales bacterium]NRA25869.1 EF-hand domain-containing protein [Opitutales bacterium]
MTNKTTTVIIAALAIITTGVSYAKSEKLSEEERAERKEQRKAELQGIVDAQDLDGDGYLSELELTAVFEEMKAARDERRAKMAAKNPDGAKQRGGERQPRSPADVAARIMNRVDQDGDGLIAKSEFFDVFHKMGERARDRREKRGGSE